MLGKVMAGPLEEMMAQVVVEDRNVGALEMLRAGVDMSRGW